jgi:hypothetical protein
MATTSDVEKAERIGRGRWRLFGLQALLFISWQGFHAAEAETPLRTVTLVQLGAWYVWVAALLLLLATGGGFLRSRQVRALLNDELTRANRSQAYLSGFWAAAITCVGLHALSMFEPLEARQAIHYILSAGIAAALITFAARERQTARLG